MNVADVACSVDEPAENVAVGVGEGQDRAHSSADEQEGSGRGGQFTFHHGVQHSFFRDEAE